MKKLSSKITIISLSFLIVMLLTLPLAYAVMEEQRFVRSEFRKKVEQIERVNLAAPHILSVDCLIFTDGTTHLVNQYSMFTRDGKSPRTERAELVSIGDSVIKYRGEKHVRILKSKSQIGE